jgi:hypothetical protein
MAPVFSNPEAATLVSNVPKLLLILVNYQLCIDVCHTLSSFFMWYGCFLQLIGYATLRL